MPSPRQSARRGSALITAMGLAAVLLFMVVSVLYLVSRERLRATRPMRELAREGCAQAGVNLARIYFATNFSNWNTYLSDPSEYNPVPATWMTGPPLVASVPTSAALRTAHPELFYDLDGDGFADVYIYVHDNQDEPYGVADNYQRDNDQNVIVGAVCISGTMAPRMENGAVDSAQLQAESLLSYDMPGKTYTGQTGGATSDGNTN